MGLTSARRLRRATRSAQPLDYLEHERSQRQMHDWQQHPRGYLFCSVCRRRWARSLLDKRRLDDLACLGSSASFKAKLRQAWHANRDARLVRSTLTNAGSQHELQRDESKLWCLRCWRSVSLRQRSLLENSICASLSSQRHTWGPSIHHVNAAEVMTESCGRCGLISLQAAQCFRKAAPCTEAALPVAPGHYWFDIPEAATDMARSSARGRAAFWGCVRCGLAACSVKELEAASASGCGNPRNTHQKARRDRWQEELL